MKQFLLLRTREVSVSNIDPKIEYLMDFFVGFLSQGNSEIAP
jgi:hypothetical protein